MIIIIGVDFHPEFQQIASVDADSGEIQEKRLAHREEAERFYRGPAGQKVRVGMEASGHARWFERPVAELIGRLAPLQRGVCTGNHDRSRATEGMHGSDRVRTVEDCEDQLTRFLPGSGSVTSG